ncbi:TLC domain-containing protein [Scheffersomyces coipomensis]|uniref:TLC domain-containing protein n=1 Tax=Scheffersomyces coipomensis TaxID=1788519 RepID=UPI00315C9EC0
MTSPKSTSNDGDTKMAPADSNESYMLYQKTYLASIERNQVSISRFILLSLYITHFLIPSGSKYTHKFMNLQYQHDVNLTIKHPSSIYDIGWDDSYIIIHGIILLTFLRSFLMINVFEPFASKFCHIYSRKAKIRFAEQSWQFTYYGYSFLFGLYLFIKSPYYFNLDNVYIGWPHYQLKSEFKLYYLMATSFWLQQIFVLNIEQKRKDHFQMFSHHIITCCLIIGSYYYYFTRIGHLILMIMDSVDTIFSFAKLLKYAGFNFLCDVMFFIFLTSWIVLRHGVYNYLLYHVISRHKILMQESQCIEGVISLRRCWTENIFNVFFGLLGGLQIITCVWMYLIIKVAYKVITGTGAEDVRSDDEDEEEEEEEEVPLVKEDIVVSTDEDDEEDVKEKDNEDNEETTPIEKESSSDGTLDEKY